MCCHPYSSSGASAYEQCLAQTPENPNWGYEPENGPSTWGGLCTCGKHQSPINIQKDWFNGNSAITFGNYDSTGPLTMTNTGHTVVISGFDNWAHQPYISDGGLGTKYRLYQFHFHWSQNAAASSEHTVDGQFFDAELHMVHVKDAFSFGQARAISDGIAALGIFYKIGFDGRSILALQNGLNEVTSNGGGQIEVRRPQTLQILYPPLICPTIWGGFFATTDRLRRRPAVLKTSCG
ncbi:hypothetical protein GPALN_012005 [Globodera pallida]|nr:hypothetical protein GPALN_012005 [Globodera pallida]